MGKPLVKEFYFNDKRNNSWKNEINDFYKKIIQKNYSNNLESAYKNLKLIKKIYKLNNYDNCS